MNLEELKHLVDNLYEEYNSYAKELDVVITLKESSFGGRAFCNVKNIYRGIDWENNQIRITPNDDLFRKEEIK